jgi:hypothetical protein
VFALRTCADNITDIPSAARCKNLHSTTGAADSTRARRWEDLSIQQGENHGNSELEPPSQEHRSSRGFGIASGLAGRRDADAEQR